MENHQFNGNSLCGFCNKKLKEDITLEFFDTCVCCGVKYALRQQCAKKIYENKSQVKNVKNFTSEEFSKRKYYLYCNGCKETKCFYCPKIHSNSQDKIICDGCKKKWCKTTLGKEGHSGDAFCMACTKQKEDEEKDKKDKKDKKEKDKKDKKKEDKKKEDKKKEDKKKEDEDKKEKEKRDKQTKLAFHKDIMKIFEGIFIKKETTPDNIDRDTDLTAELMRRNCYKKNLMNIFDTRTAQKMLPNYDDLPKVGFGFGGYLAINKSSLYSVFGDNGIDEGLMDLFAYLCNEFIKFKSKNNDLPDIRFTYTDHLNNMIINEMNEKAAFQKVKERRFDKEGSHINTEVIKDMKHWYNDTDKGSVSRIQEDYEDKLDELKSVVLPFKHKDMPWCFFEVKFTSGVNAGDAPTLDITDFMNYKNSAQSKKGKEKIVEKAVWYAKFFGMMDMEDNKNNTLRDIDYDCWDMIQWLKTRAIPKSNSICIVNFVNEPGAQKMEKTGICVMMRMIDMLKKKFKRLQ